MPQNRATLNDEYIWFADLEPDLQLRDKTEEDPSQSRWKQLSTVWRKFKEKLRPLKLEYDIVRYRIRNTKWSCADDYYRWASRRSTIQWEEKVLATQARDAQRPHSVPRISAYRAQQAHLKSRNRRKKLWEKRRKSHAQETAKANKHWFF